MSDEKEVQVSLYGASMRPQNWKNFYEDVAKTNLSFEIVFAGPCSGTPQDQGLPENFRYIKTADIKPAQCWQISAHHTKGELLFLAVDDEILSPYGLDEAYAMYQEAKDYKAIVAFQPWVYDANHLDTLKFPMGSDGVLPNAIQLVPSCSLMSRKFFFEVGGFDRKFLAGQGDLDMYLRAYFQGGKFLFSPTARATEGMGWAGLQRGAVAFYNHDRPLLDMLWIADGKLRTSPSEETTLFEFNDSIYTVTQGQNNPRWV